MMICPFDRGAPLLTPTTISATHVASATSPMIPRRLPLIRSPPFPLQPVCNRPSPPTSESNPSSFALQAIAAIRGVWPSVQRRVHLIPGLGVASNPAEDGDHRRWL